MALPCFESALDFLKQGNIYNRIVNAINNIPKILHFSDIEWIAKCYFFDDMTRVLSEKMAVGVVVLTFCFGSRTIYWVASHL